MSRVPLIFCAVLAFAFCAHAATDAPSPTPHAPDFIDTPERRQALDLYDEFKMAQAVPLLEKLSAQYPRDFIIMERYGVSLLSYSATLPDPAQRKLTTAKARGILLKAKALGDDSNLLKTLLNLIPEGGSDGTYSASKEAQDAMDQAEADFARGDMDKALGSYQRALIFDPNLYEAALFSGDACYKQHDNILAGKWYDRAIHIDPDRETAYRYWGDSLMAQDKMDDARGKFIQAVVAEPYVDRPWTGLSQWAGVNNVTLSSLKLHDQGSATTTGSNTTIRIDSSSKAGDPASAGWLTYGLIRAQWQTEKFKKTFSAESYYRHSLPEEADALHSMVKVLEELPKEELPYSPDLAQLIKIDKAGLLEPYILLERPDDGIVKDYPAYRATHRDLLFQYLDQFVAPKAPPHIP